MADPENTTFPVTTTPSKTTLEDSNTTLTVLPTTQTSTAIDNSTSTSTNGTVTDISTPVAEETDHTGAIAGGVIGGILGIVLVIVAVILILRRKRHKKRKKQEKLNNLPGLPSVDQLQQTETLSKHNKKHWEEKPKPEKAEIVSNDKESSNEPHYVNEKIDKSKKQTEPLYLKPEPPKRDIYCGPYDIEYYMQKSKTDTSQVPTEVYSDPNQRQSKDFPTEEAPKSPYANTVLNKNGQYPGDYENVPKKRTKPRNDKPTQVEDEEEQVVYENH